MTNLNDLKIKIFLDTANLESIQQCKNKYPYVRGFTTNPSLIHLSGAKNYKSYALKILNICKKKPISFEVFGDTFDHMLKQANIINS